MAIIGLHKQRQQSQSVENDRNKCHYIKLVLVLVALGILVNVYFLLLRGVQSTSKEVSERVTSTAYPALVNTNYRHDNLNLRSEKECTQEQRDKISHHLGLETGNVNVQGCNEPDWLDSFFEEEMNIGTETFLGISVGCNKGTDAVQMARLGMSDSKFNVSAWTAFLGSIITVCPAREQGPIMFSKRNGEMHCIEPMLNNIALIRNASQNLGLPSEEFVVTQAAIGARNGVVEFPNADAGAEACGLQGCEGWVAGANNAYIEVPLYSLDSYAEKYVLSNGPINILAIDAEGWDFDVLFGASSVLDRAYYVEFEYHMIGKWGQYHLLDSVRLLDGKGFTCYWLSGRDLWRITECYFDVYNTWHYWSNVACVHRSFSVLAERMEIRFNMTLEKQ